MASCASAPGRRCSYLRGRARARLGGGKPPVRPPYKLVLIMMNVSSMMDTSTVVDDTGRSTCPKYSRLSTCPPSTSTCGPGRLTTPGGPPPVLGPAGACADGGAWPSWLAPALGPKPRSHSTRPGCLGSDGGTGLTSWRGPSQPGLTWCAQSPPASGYRAPAITVTAKCEDGDVSNVKTSWWRRWDSNPRPPACKAGALATELRPREHVENLV